MSKIGIRVSEGSEILSVSTDDETITEAFVEFGEGGQVQFQDVNCDPTYISELEARCCFTSDDLPDPDSDPAE